MTFGLTGQGPQSRLGAKFVLTIFFFFACAGALVWLLLYSQRLADEIEIIRGSILSQNHAIANLSLLKQESQKAQELEPYLRNILPDTEKLLTVSAKLESIARSAGLDQNFSFGSEAPSTPVEPKSFGISLSLGGTPRGFAEYFKALEALPHIITFTHIEVNSSGGRSQMNASGKVYAR